MRLPHPIVLLGAAVVVAAALTWVLPAGQYDRRDDPATGRRVVVAGTYHVVPSAPVGPFGAGVAIPRGFVAAADVVATVLFVGAVWILVDRLGTLPAVVAALVRAFAGRRLLIIPVLSIFFGTMGALENMQEEIIPLIPALLVLGAGVGMDGVAVVAMSAGAAMVGSAFGPTNPFQAAIALKLAQMPPLSFGAGRLLMFIAGLALWIGWTMRYAARHHARSVVLTSPSVEGQADAISGARHAVIFIVALAPMAAYVYGVLRFDWGFNELSGAFLLGGIAAGLIGGFRVARTVAVLVEGVQTMLPAAMMVGLARSISVVLEDGRVVDTILHGLVTALSVVPAMVAALLMIPFQGLLHVAVPSVSGQAVLTMPLFVPLADVLGLSRQVPVLAYQTGAGLMELATPTNGALMAVLLAAGVSFGRWMRFALGGILLLVLIGVAGIVGASPTRAAAAEQTLDIYFIDVEGGQSTLIVTPMRQTLLIDAGYAGFGDRDPQRILAAARDAGVTRIDDLLVTHFHRDHVGGVPALARLIPIGTFIDGGAPFEHTDTIDAAFAAYDAMRPPDRHHVAKPGDRVPLTGLDVDIVSSAGATLTKPLSGAGQANSACAGFERHDPDTTENTASLGVRVQYGKFRLLDPGDLPWNSIAQLACPRNLIGAVDVYLVSHHGNADTAVPALLAALRPRVAILNNGPMKGGEPAAFASLRHADGVRDVWQLHRALADGAMNSPDEFVANLEADETASHWLKLTARPDGTFAIVNGRTSALRRY